MIVADANLIIHFVVRNEGSELADEVCAADAIWVAPLLWRSEVRNALLKYLQHGLMGLDSVMIAWHLAEEAIDGREYTVDSRKVLELARQSKCTAFDCEYVALAQDLGIPLVTTNKQVLKAFPKTAVALEKFVKKR